MFNSLTHKKSFFITQLYWNSWHHTNPDFKRNFKCETKYIKQLPEGRRQQTNTDKESPCLSDLFSSFYLNYFPKDIYKFKNGDIENNRLGEKAEKSEFGAV